MSTKHNALAGHIADVRRTVEQVPVGEKRTELEIRLNRAAADLARQIAGKTRTR